MNEEPERILLGEHEVPDAQRLLNALDEAGIPFEAETSNRPDQNGYWGSAGRNSHVQVWVPQAFAETAQAIQTKILRIEL